MNSKQKKIVIGVFAGAAVLLLVFCGVIFFQGKDAEQTMTPTDVAKSGEMADAPQPEPTKDPHEGLVRSSLTGQWVKPSVEKKRPVAVVINNIQYAYDRQKGTSRADIIYEALAEGGITRMLAIYQDVDNIKTTGSVRSARHYFVQFASEWDAIFCHFGHTKYAVNKMDELRTQNLSGLSGIGSTVFYRDYSMSAPHNVYTNGKRIKKGAKKLKYSLKKREGRQAEHFDFYEKETDLPGGKKGKSVSLPFSYYSTCNLKYSAKKKQYLLSEYGRKHMDIQSKKQLAFKNVIVQFVEEKNIDRNGYQTMELTHNTGKGYYFTRGKRRDITWSRNEKNNTMVYEDETGATLSINPGKTYIAVFPKNRQKLVKIK